MEDKIETIYGCQSIKKEIAITHVMVDEVQQDIETDLYIIILKDGSESQTRQTKVGGLNTDGRNAITEIDGEPIKSVKQECYCNNEEAKCFRVYTTEPQPEQG